MHSLRIFFFSLLIGLSSVSVYAKQALSNSLGIYISNRGQRILNQNVPLILFNNGISSEEFFIKEKSFELPEKPLEDFAGDDPEVRDLLIQTRDYLERFLMGLEFNDPNFQISMKNMELVAEWNHFQALATKAEANETYPGGGVVFQLDIEAKNIRFDLGKIRLIDKNNDFLGEFGIDNLWLGMTEDSVPLRISFPIHVYNKGNGQFHFEVKNPFTNLDQLELATDFKSPLILPKVEININGRTFGLNQEEIEKSVRDARQTLITSVQQSGQEFVDKKLAETLTRLMNEKYHISGLEMNEMEPPGAEEENPKPLIWGMKINQINFIKDHLFLGLNGSVHDPQRPNAPHLLLSQNSNKLPDFDVNKFGDFDAALSINRGFFNRIVQLSYNRGYFNTFDVEGEDKPIKLSQKPTIKIFEKNGKTEAKLDLQIEYKVTGFSSVFVKNPIRIDFDLNLAFKKNNSGVTQIIVDGVDLGSVNVDSRYIRMFSGKVRKAVKDKFKDVDMKGMVLVEELPIPESIAGVPLKIVGSHWDKNGYIIMLLDVGFER